MKFKDIADMCRCKKYMVLYTNEEAGEQFVSDGAAVFKLEGMPILSVKALLRLFSVDEKAQKTWFFEEAAMPDFGYLDNDVPEQMVENFSDMLMLNFCENEFVPVRTSKGILLINRRYLKPFERSEYIRFFEREYKGTTYIAVKDGLELKAVIAPYKVEIDFVEQLGDIYSGLLESGVQKCITE